jgi:glycerol uptake facilitator-like aquaporin
MMKIYLAEVIGTMIMMILGDGVVANVLLHKSKGQGGGLDGNHHGLGFSSHHCHLLRWTCQWRAP